MNFNSTESLHQVITQPISGKVKHQENNNQFLNDKDFLYQLVIENGPLGVAIVDLNFKILKVNSTLCHLLGYSVDELLSMTIKDISNPDDYTDDTCQFKLLLENKIPFYTLEKRFLKKDQTILYTRLTANINRDENGNPLYAVGYIEDITDQKRAHQKVSELEERYKAVHSMSGEIIYIYDLDGKLVEINETAEKILGYNTNDIKDLKIKEFVSFEDQNLYEQRKSKLLKGESLAVATYKVRKKDGEFIEIESNVSLIHRDGKPYAFLGIARDITDRKKMYTELMANREKYKNLFEKSPVCLWVEDFTEIKKYADELRKKGIKDFREYFKINPSEILVFLKRGIIKNVNQEALKLYKASSKHGINKQC